MPSKVGKIGLRIRNTLAHRALILAYHRVCPPSEPDPFRLQVSPSSFQAQLQLLTRYTVLSLAELVSRLAAGRLPRRSVVLTFDDGYADNLIYGKPLLEKFRVPATVFVTSGYVGRPSFWWDRLLQVVRTAQWLPSEIRLSAGDNLWTWQTDNATNGGTRSRGPAGERPGQAARHDCYLALWRFIRDYPLETKENLIDQLTSQLPGANTRLFEARPCTGEEVLSLISGGLVSVGAHSVTHPVLSSLSPEQQAAELRGSRVRLEELTGSPVLDFSYPHGTIHDLNASSIRSASQAGFRCACTSVRGVVESNTELFQLPRIAVADLDAEELDRLLRKHLSWTSPGVGPAQEADGNDSRTVET